MNVHMVYNGETWDYEAADLGLGDNPTNEEVLNALANEAGIPRVKLQGMIVNSSPDTGDLTVSPRALFGVAVG